MGCIKVTHHGVSHVLGYNEDMIQDLGLQYLSPHFVCLPSLLRRLNMLIFRGRTYLNSFNSLRNMIVYAT